MVVLNGHFILLQFCGIKLYYMAVEIVTREDLQELRKQLLEDLKLMITPPQKTNKGWLRSSDVRAMLKISPATLQNFRLNGTLPFSKINGIHFYRQSDIEKLLETHFHNGK